MIPGYNLSFVGSGDFDGPGVAVLGHSSGSRYVILSKSLTSELSLLAC